MLCGRQHHTLCTVSSNLTFGNLIFVYWGAWKICAEMLGPLCCVGPTGRPGMESQFCLFLPRAMFCLPLSAFLGGLSGSISFSPD